MPRRIRVEMRGWGICLLALVACSSAPEAVPSPSASASVRGAIYAPVVDLDAVRACTLLSVGEIARATEHDAGAPVELPTDAPSCTWAIDEVDAALRITVSTADDYSGSPVGVEEPGLGDEALWVPSDGQDEGELRVLIDARDRSLVIALAPGAVVDARAAARALALRLIPRV